MNFAQNGNRAKASKLAPPDATWTYKESGVNSGSVTTFDDGHEEQKINTGTRAYFDKNGGTITPLNLRVHHVELTHFQSTNES